MMTHIQAFFCLDSLGTKIQVEVNKKMDLSFINSMLKYSKLYYEFRKLEIIHIIQDIPGKLIQMQIHSVKLDPLLLPVQLMPTYGYTCLKINTMDTLV